MPLSGLVALFEMPRQLAAHTGRRFDPGWFGGSVSRSPPIRIRFQTFRI